jgi:hypothetical protein
LVASSQKKILSSGYFAGSAREKKEKQQKIWWIKSGKCCHSFKHNSFNIDKLIFFIIDYCLSVSWNVNLKLFLLLLIYILVYFYFAVFLALCRIVVHLKSIDFWNSLDQQLVIFPTFALLHSPPFPGYRVLIPFFFRFFIAIRYLFCHAFLQILWMVNKLSVDISGSSRLTFNCRFLIPSA